MKIFSVSTLTGDVVHLGTDKKIPLCGIYLFDPELMAEVEIKSDLVYDEYGEIDNVCKNCLKASKLYSKKSAI